MGGGKIKPPFTVDAPGYQPVEGETIPRRNVKYKDQLLTRPEDGINTVYDIVKRGAEKFGNAKCMGSRELLHVHVETKKVKKMVGGEEQEVDKEWTFYELSGYSFITFHEYERLALQIGAGLRKLGLVKGDRLHLFASTSPRWLASAHGAASQSMAIVTSYDTLGEEGLRYSMLETNSKAVYTESHLLKLLTKVLGDVNSIKIVIYNNTRQLEEEALNAAKSAHPSVTFLSFDELREIGKEHPTDAVPPYADDIGMIMYTSGATGTPKGVPLKHKHVVAAVAGINSLVGHKIGPSDVLLNYLPLAHIFEFVFEHAALYWGSTMGYGNPKTLADLSTRHCKGDIRELRPTLMVGVPAVWETVRKGIMAKVEQSGFISKNMFSTALNLKRRIVNHQWPGAEIVNSLVFKKVTDATGGRLRFVMNGAGPIAKETQEFMSLVIAPMVIGYGLTETAAMTSVSDPWGWREETLGDIPGCIEIKLVDFPDAGYFTKSSPPQGEVWIRGNSVMEGYYNNETLTAEVMTPDGWFKTGDIGEWDQNGHLKVIDRKKSLVKTLNGEYIALEKLESVYRSVGVVANICVYAAPEKAKPIALVVPAEPALKNLAAENGIKGRGFEELVHNKKLQKIVLQNMQAVGRKAGLAGLEIIDGVVLVDEPWTPQNGLTTATEKLNRKGIHEKHKTEIEHAYGDEVKLTPSYVEQMPDVRAVKFNVNYFDRARVSPGYWFVAPYWFLDAPPSTGEYEPCQAGPAIYDEDGHLVWSGACVYNDGNRNAFDFRVAEHVTDRTVLSFVLQATPDIMAVKPTGFLLNDRYEVEKTIVANNTEDVFGMHEFEIINNGETVLVCGDRPEIRSMMHLDPARHDKSWFTSGVVMELQVDNGNVLYNWNSRAEVELNEGFHILPDTPVEDHPLGLDYFHINSVDKTPDGNYLISARYTNTVYLLSGAEPKILWRLGGKHSDFAMDFTFSRQHNARTRFLNETHMIISILNNASDDWGVQEPTSSALFILLDLVQHTASVLNRYNRPDHGHSRMRGNVQVLPNNNVFVGWSEGGYQSEFAPDGTLLMDARFAIPSNHNKTRFNSYRSYKYPFVGRPQHPPALVAAVHGSQAAGFMTVMHASWNGATEVKYWKFYAQHNATAERVLVGNATKIDFETEFAVQGYLDWITVEAVDGTGNNTLGWSGVIRPKLPDHWAWDEGMKGLDWATLVADPGVLFGGLEEGGSWGVLGDAPVAAAGMGVLLLIVSGAVGLQDPSNPSLSGRFGLIGPRQATRTAPHKSSGAPKAQRENIPRHLRNTSMSVYIMGDIGFSTADMQGPLELKQTTRVMGVLYVFEDANGEEVGGAGEAREGRWRCG
ncbi:hypothetical protein AJ79_03632 [Helicocarpus griseus UAMH5409]|uniref:AMP-dependent synthetase/ligase domain-containing protein n=1 Tax=Helicocarpus griseus UAMH5409 TaxID=1447875 RepID=A0A2B7XY04_9EURO|nr:hypothetical protein AJ79_03632 [Helicocarpus griseus UAMH5409]